MSFKRKKNERKENQRKSGEGTNTKQKKKVKLEGLNRRPERQNPTGTSYQLRSRPALVRRKQVKNGGRLEQNEPTGTRAPGKKREWDNVGHDRESEIDQVKAFCQTLSQKRRRRRRGN